MDADERRCGNDERRLGNLGCTYRRNGTLGMDAGTHTEASWQGPKGGRLEIWTRLVSRRRHHTIWKGGLSGDVVKYCRFFSFFRVAGPGEGWFRAAESMIVCDRL